jgi:predicted ArsR family transcriptional regulator
MSGRDREGEDSVDSPIASAGIELERDIFLRTLVRQLAGTLESVVGLEEAEGFVSVVGQRMGEWINSQYLVALGRDSLDRGEVAEVLVDLKKRIKGDFYVIEQNDDKIVLGNRACPFGDRVLGRPSMCMMTSNVFGVIAADHLGYARVELQETIATGAAGCKVTVHLRTPPEGEASGREYFRA